MASTSKQAITSSSYSSPQWIHDVFLSFRGKDTRDNFTSHLHSNLAQNGIDVYLDDKGLERGKTIEPALWKAIEKSRFSVIIFSTDYASSPWCLDELVKIVQCMKDMEHTVLPVFYDVDPTEVSEQKGNYEKAFFEHEQNFKENLDKVRSWKDCLTTVASQSGWDIRNRNESESIKIIVEYIQSKLSFTLPTISNNLVGIDSRLEVLNGYIGEEAKSVLFVGICGMGGIGKTTLARLVYDRIRWHFQVSCFLANVREVFVENEGSRRLQEQLLSEIEMKRVNVCDSFRGTEMIKRSLPHKKVLLILDDVDDQKQLECLAAEHEWFGPGSRIIITSRDKNVLDRNCGTKIYEAEKLSDDDALMLFSWKAFKKDQPVEDFEELSKEVVGYANGLPLALEVIGSFLHGRSILIWKSAIDRLNDIPDRKIIDVLRISFDGLHELEKEIFLDIACFLKGFKKDRIIRILDSCEFYAESGIQILIEKSLINVSRDQVWMHNLLQKMGKEIVRCESPKERGRRSRLWAYKDVYLALMDNKGKKNIETIFLDMPVVEEAQWNMKAFSKMSKLRLLKIHNVQFSEGPKHLSNELRFLEWHDYPSKSLPAYFQPDKLVELDMAYSNVEQLWYGVKSSVNLKIINLSHSLNLTKTPDFTGIPNLESLILEGCTRLLEVHPSFGYHKKLQYVNLVKCTSLRILPNNLEMESLKVFTLDGCSKLENFPDILGNMNCLMVLRLDETRIAELSSSIHHLIGLGLLSMNNCMNLEIIPSSIGYLKSLKKLDLSGCCKLKNIPENLGKVESLEEFDVSGTSIRQPPASIFLLKNLEVLSFEGCKRIVLNPMDQVLPSLSGLSSLEILNLCACDLREGAIPEDIGCLSSLRCLDLSRNYFVSLPKTINQLSRLEMLDLEDCRMLESLPEVPSKVQTLNLNGCICLKEIPDPIKLSSSKISEFTCLNCWELYKYNGQDNIVSMMLASYLQGLSNPRPGFAIVVPGNEIPGWFNHQSKGSSISLQVPSSNMDGEGSGRMGFVVCVAFSACGESPLFCHFKANGRENYPSPMCISRNSIQVLSDHVWLFYLSFAYLKELKEWQHESFSNIELSFQFYERGLKVKNCGVSLLYTPLPSSSIRFVASKEAASSFIASLCYYQWMHKDFLSIGGTSASNEANSALKMDTLLLPPWLESLLSTSFFSVCRTHGDAERSECNMYCLDCEDDAFCFYCRSSRHKDHQVIQIRRSSYHAVVRVSEIQRVLDISGVQTYVINSARVLFLNERPQPRSGKGVAHICGICGRGILDCFRFCSLGCKKLMPLRSRVFDAIEGFDLFIVIFARDFVYLPWSSDKLVKILGFVNDMRSNSVFPVSYRVKPSNIDDQKESYTIVIDKDGEYFRANDEKVKGWMNILTEVATSTGIIDKVDESLKRFHPSDEELVLYYLKRKICEKSSEPCSIPDVDIHKWDTEEVPGQAMLENEGWQWYFFSPRDGKYPKTIETIFLDMPVIKMEHESLLKNEQTKIAQNPQRTAF